MRKRIGQVTLRMYCPTKPLKNGSYAPYIRIQYENQKYAISTRCEVTARQWKEYEACPEDKHPLTVEWNKIADKVRELVNNGEFSILLLRETLQDGKRNSVQAIARQTATAFRNRDKHNSASLYELLATTLDEFHGAPIRLSQCTAELCQAYLRWLADKRKNNPTTISMRARNLTAVLNTAVERRLIKENPMRKVKKPSALRKDLTIREESLSKLLNAGPDMVDEKEYRSLLYFRCLYYGNGLNMTDLLHLRKENITEKEIIFHRRKTETASAGRQIHVALIPELVRSLDALSSGREHIIGILDGVQPYSYRELTTVRQAIKTTNKYLRSACKTLSIPERVTTGTARHAFATRLLQKGVPIEYISDALGHTNIRTTQHYLDGYTIEQRQHAAKLLTLD